VSDVHVLVERLDPEVPLPTLASAGAAGHDVVAWLPEGVAVIVYLPQGRCTLTGSQFALPPGARALIPTGLSLAIPEGYEVQVRPRSGLALKEGVTVLNSPGTVDSDYRGEVGVILINHGHQPFVVRHGERIAQLVVAPVTPALFLPVAHLDATRRGLGGFGSTGRTSNLTTV
jgi:dUTP pyrophosphatase